MRTLGMLLLVLLLSLPPLLIDLGVRDATTSMERISLLSTLETWLRQHDGESNAWRMPSLYGKPRVVKPPLLVWLNMLAWSDCMPMTCSSTELILRARLVTATLAVITLASIYGIGLTLGDRKLAVLATLVAGSIFFFQRQARTASYDMHMTAWATLAIASALWGMRPLGTVPALSRQLLGWGGTGLAVALACMTKTPLALAVTGLPVLGAISVLPDERRPRLLGLCGAVAVAVALTAPWYMYAWQHVAGMGQQTIQDLRALRTETQPFYYYLGLLGLVLPWTCWMIAGLLAPFGSGGAGRRPRLIVWVWFVLVFTFFSLPPPKTQRYILPVIPAVALMVAQVWLEQGGEPDTVTWRGKVLQRLHWAGLSIVSLLFGPFLASQNSLLMQGWLPGESVAPLAWPAACTVSALLAGLALTGWRWHRHRKRVQAALATAVRALLVCTVFWHAAAYGPSATFPLRAEAERVAHKVGSAPVRYLRLSRADRLTSEGFLFYLRRIVRPVTRDEMGDYARSARRVYVMATAGTDHDQAMRTAGFTAIDDSQCERGSAQRQRLWE